MNIYAVTFYLIAAVILAATALAITRRNPVHAVIYLIISFLGSALLFYLLGAPFLAAVEVIIYAGAIMVLFLFVVMILRVEKAGEPKFRPGQWGPATLLGFLFLLVVAVLVFKDPGSRVSLEKAVAMPRDFGHFVFQRYFLAIEIISFLLLVALLAALHIGRGNDIERTGHSS
ncbi:MAG: NADH-quinone oxidoreductase subunit J [Pseudomonadota bacterium]